MNTALDLSEADAGCSAYVGKGWELAALVQQLNPELYEPSMAEHNHSVECDLQADVIIEADRSLLNPSARRLEGQRKTAHLAAWMLP